jgi:hypothetical protein
MPSTVLSLVQDFCDKYSLPYPNALVGSTDKTIRQYRGIMMEVIRDLSEYRWEEQKVRKTWTSIAGSDQGTLMSIFGPDYISLIAESVWNNTRKMKIYGPLSEQVWQALKVLPNAGPEYQCWISQGHLYVSPDLVAGNELAGIYTTSYVVLGANNVAKARVTVDNDVLLFPDVVVLRAFEWKWQKVKGLPDWQDSYNDYMTLLARNVVKDSAGRLSLDRPHRSPRPGIVIPAGSWNV